MPLDVSLFVNSAHDARGRFVTGSGSGKHSPGTAPPYRPAHSKSDNLQAIQSLLATASKIRPTLPPPEKVALRTDPHQRGHGRHCAIGAVRYGDSTRAPGLVPQAGAGARAGAGTLTRALSGTGTLGLAGGKNTTDSLARAGAGTQTRAGISAHQGPLAPSASGSPDLVSTQDFTGTLHTELGGE